MTIDAHYFSPTTPGAASFDEDVSSYIRLGSITGLAGEARMGATGEGNIVLDDPGSTIGHLADGILGLKQFYVNETACPAGNQRMWTGYIYDRRYQRGTGPRSSLRLGTDREIDVTLVDVNDFLSFRVFAPEADDPTSDFAGLAETDLERVQRMLSTVDFLTTTLFDIGYIPATGGVDMSAKDYEGMRPIDVLNDCAQASGRNFWVLYDETGNQLVLWYDVYTTDGTATLAYDSALRLTNVASEHDGSTTFAIAPDAVETLDPSRLVSASYLNGDGVKSYRTLATTANIYAWRDQIAPAVFVKDQTKLDALNDRYLADNSTEDAKISCTVQLPAAKVTGIHEGMRLQVHFTHLPKVNSGFTWCRVMSRTIRQDKETEALYWLDLELSPIPVGVEPYAVLWRAQTDDDFPDYVAAGIYPIVWECSGDLDEAVCLASGLPYLPTVGPLAPTHGTISDPLTPPSTGPIGYYLGFTFLAGGTIDFTSNYTAITAINGITCTVDILVDGIVVATGSGVTAGGFANITVNATGVVIPGAGSVLRGEFTYPASPGRAIYLDDTGFGPPSTPDFTITGGSLFA